MLAFSAVRENLRGRAKVSLLLLVSTAVALGIQGCTVGNDHFISTSKACQRAVQELSGNVDDAQTVDFDPKQVPDDCLLATNRNGQEFLFAWDGRLKTMTNLGPMGHSDDWGFSTQGVELPTYRHYSILITAGGRYTLEFFLWDGNGLRRVLYLHSKTLKTSFIQHGMSWPIVLVRYPDGKAARYVWNGFRYAKHGIGEQSRTGIVRAFRNSTP